MKKKSVKIFVSLVVLALILVLGFFANAFLGNPISKQLATRTAKAHLAEQYTDTDFYIEDVRFDFKGGYYYAHIKSPSSADSHFTLYLGMDGKLSRDSYKQDVLHRFNTATRLDDQYRDLVDSVLESPSLPFGLGYGYGILECTPREYVGCEGVPPHALIQEELELDRAYDIPKLGAEAGHLLIYAKEETVSVERTVEILLEIRRLMDDGGVPFRTIDFTLVHSKPEKGPLSEERVDVLSFPYEDIHADGMIERVKAANDAAIAYYAEQDALYKEY